MRLIGLNFYPGTATILWDAVTSIGTVTVNATGGFDTSITIPTATVGAHWVVVQDAGVSFYTVVYVTPTLNLTPSSGPVGTNVTATGIGFSASVGTTVYNVTLTWTPFSGTPYAIAWALTDATGQFTTTFIVPHDAGGARTVVATTNVTAVTSSRDFTITPSLILTLDTKAKPAQPIGLNNNASLVYAVGNGFDPTVLYSPNIDNNLLGTNPLGYAWASSVMPNATGDIVVGFIADGFSYGSHVISFYTPPTAIPAVWATFNVMLTAGDPTVDMLTQINQTVTGLSGLSGVNSTLLTGMDAKLTALNATLIAINGNIATLSTNVGIIRANVTTIMPVITSINSGIATVQTAVGTLQTSLSSLGSTLTSISGTVGTISTSVGALDTDLSAINTKVTSIDGKTATIQTDLGTLQGTVTATDGKVATIQTNLGTLQADVSDVQTTLDAVPGQISTPIWIAVVLALIAAIAAIACLILMRRKIAG